MSYSIILTPLQRVGIFLIMLEMYKSLHYPFELPELPYEFNDLEPSIDSKTMEIHHGKHHATYLTKLNTALEQHPDLHAKSLAELLLEIETLPESIKQAVVNNGGGHANHLLFWDIMTKNQTTQPSEEFTTALHETFGGFEAFKKKFTEEGLNRFGSGWVWLSLDGDGKNLHIGNTPNQNSPLLEQHIPILGLDVWEHAYYLNYQNRRADYIQAWWNVVNWEKVSQYFNTYKDKTLI